MYKIINKSVKRIDAYEKVTGKAKELDELNKQSLEEIKGMLKYAIESPEPETKDALKYIYAGREVEGR